ncbi:MAG: hypothetical protein M1838_001448 [Thelocarpon superellum]|nr:MAG: hypothetical protein M1838_001448 [Thelocarpon superellum]
MGHGTLWDTLLWPSLQAGALSGSSALIIGRLLGSLYSTTPVLFTIASGVQWFAVGSGFWGGRRNAVPGMVMFSLFGLAGQGVYNRLDAQHMQQQGAGVPDRAGPGFWHRLAQKKWTPVQVLSDEEYEQLLREKALRIEAEIAVIEDDMKLLQESATLEHANETR